MFADWHWNENRVVSQDKKYTKWKKHNRDKKIVIIELGAGTAILTVRHQGEVVAKLYNKKLIRINPRDFEVDLDYGYGIPLKAKEGIERILK